MRKMLVVLIVFILGITTGYYACFTGSFSEIFTSYYKAFQVGVYTDKDAAVTYSSKYDNAIIVKDDELYRVYVSILKGQNNIRNMSLYLDSLGIDYYLRDISISDKAIKKEIEGYESLMNNESEIVFLELNKMIVETYKESL